MLGLARGRRIYALQPVCGRGLKAIYLPTGKRRILSTCFWRGLQFSFVNRALLCVRLLWYVRVIMS
jgi:hypothetical protein